MSRESFSDCRRKGSLYLLHCTSTRRMTQNASTTRLNNSTGGHSTNYSGNLKSMVHSEMLAYPYLALQHHSLIRNLLFRLEVRRDRLVECLSTYPTIFWLCSSGNGQITLKTTEKTYRSQDSSEEETLQRNHYVYWR